MNNLDYKIVRKYAEHTDFSATNYLCKDNYVHVRLKKYGDKPLHICGFEAKLTFLLTALIQLKVGSSLDLAMVDRAESKENYQEIWEHCLASLKSTKEYKDVEYVLKTVFANFKGVKILPMYSLKNKPKNAFSLLGGCDNFPCAMMSDVLDCGMYYDFTDIVDFLLNNNVEVYIEEHTEVDDSKYINKYTEKVETIHLW